MDLLRTWPLCVFCGSPDVCRDPKDNMLLELAVAGQAEVVVSGDKDILDLGEFEGIFMELPANFLEHILR